MTDLGLGDTVARWTKALGLHECRGCQRRRRWLNMLVPYKSAKPIDKVPGRGVTKWAIGITTAPRKEPTLARTVASVRSAGWTPTIFAEPGCDLSGTAGCKIVQRAERLGAWRNWRDMCRRLLETHPDAEAILTIQDDTELVADLREFLERDLWPSPRCGFVSLYTAKHYGIMWEVWKEGERLSRHINEMAARRRARSEKAEFRQIARSVGCHKVSTGSFWGACALVFPRPVLAAIVDHPIAERWRGVRSPKGRRREPWEIANVDTAIGKIVRGLRLEMRTYTPSLAQHFARYSSIGHGDNSGRRSAPDYVGATANLDDLFAARVNPTRYYLDGTPHLTGDAEYDEAMLAWHKRGREVSMSISQPCWAEIRKHLKPGMRTLEFGSGLSTLLFAKHPVQHTAIEQDPSVAADVGLSVQVCPLKDGWYDWQPNGPYDLVLIDGPQGTGNRERVLSVLDRLVHERTIVIVDDTHRENELRLAARISQTVGIPCMLYPTVSAAGCIADA